MTQKYTKISDTPTNPCGVECMALLTSSLNMADSLALPASNAEGIFPADVVETLKYYIARLAIKVKRELRRKHGQTICKSLCFRPVPRTARGCAGVRRARPRAS